MHTGTCASPTSRRKSNEGVPGANTSGGRSSAGTEKAVQNRANSANSGLPFAWDSHRASGSRDPWKKGQPGISRPRGGATVTVADLIPLSECCGSMQRSSRGPRDCEGSGIGSPPASWPSPPSSAGLLYLCAMLRLRPFLPGGMGALQELLDFFTWLLGGRWVRGVIIIRQLKYLRRGQSRTISDSDPRVRTQFSIQANHV